MSIALLEPPQRDTLVDAPRTRRLLLVAYNFPPVGGAGVQRPVKWAKYLGRCGWDVTVLTTLNPSVPVRDESLLAEVPADVQIVRARTWEPDYRLKQNLIANQGPSGLLTRVKGMARKVAKSCVSLALQPDPQVLWNFDAIRVGTRLLAEQHHDAILVTAPAYSSFYIGAALKRTFGLPLVLDFRDEWDLSGKYLENARRDWFTRGIQSRMQTSLLRQADCVLATTRRSTQALAEKLDALCHRIPAECIYNGYDAEDFSGHSACEQALPIDHGCDVMQPEKGTLRIVYTGTLWNLTDIDPLVRAIEHLDTIRPELSARLELVCVGRKTSEQLAILNRLKNTSARLVPIDYCDHTTALQWMRSAHALCLLLSDVPGADRVVPAKLFEYLAVQNEMLAICPGGETAEIVRRFCPHSQFEPGHVSAIEDWLIQRLEGVHKAPAAPLEDSAIREFSRESQTQRLAEILNELTAARCEATR